MSKTLHEEALETVATQTRVRSDVPEKDRWNLSDIYPSDETWQQACAKLAEEYPALAAFKGTLANGPSHLLDCLALNNRIDKTLSRLSCYASMHSDADTRVFERLVLCNT